MIALDDKQIKKALTKKPALALDPDLGVSLLTALAQRLRYLTGRLK